MIKIVLLSMILLAAAVTGFRVGTNVQTEHTQAINCRGIRNTAPGFTCSICEGSYPAFFQQLCGMCQLCPDFA